MKLFGLFRDSAKRVTLSTHQFVDLRAPRDAFKYRRKIECRRSTQAIPWTPRMLAE